MKFIQYLNYFVQLVSVAVLVIASLMLTALKDFSGGDSGDTIIVLLISLLFIGFYQLLFSFISILVNRSRSLFRYHLLGTVLFFFVFAVLSYLVYTNIIDNSVMAYFDRNEIYSGIAFFAIPIGLFVYFCFISFMKLNPFKITTSEEVK